MTVSFTTSNASGKYYINDTSVDASDAPYKRVKIFNAAQEEIFDSGQISPSVNPVEVSTTNWLSQNALVQIFVELRYPTPGGDGISVTQTYLLPTLLNLKG